MKIDQQTIWRNEMEESRPVDLPHLCYEPRKPVMSGSTPLIQNTAEVHSDAIIISHDVQVQEEIQLETNYLQYNNHNNNMPDLVTPIRRGIGDEEQDGFPRKRYKYNNLKWKNRKQ